MKTPVICPTYATEIDARRRRMGSARQLATPYQVRRRGRWLRVYRCGYSASSPNADACYIVTGGQPRYLSAYSLVKLPEVTA